MFLSIIILLTLILVLLKYVKYVSRNVANFPEMPGSLPVIGHLHYLYGDTTNIWEFVKQTTRNALKNGGYTTFLLGPIRFYIVADPDDSLTILNANPERHYVYSFAEAWLGKGLLTADYHTWSSHKKLLYPMFGQQHLNTFMPIFNKQARKLVERFSEKVGQGAFNHEPDALITGLETICQTALGSDVGEKITNNKEYVSAINVLLNILSSRMVRVWFHSQKLFELSFLRKVEKKNLNIVHRTSSELIQKRKSHLYTNEKTVDKEVITGEISPFIDALLQAEFENENFDFKQVRDEINTLILTGYETTATGLVYTMMLLGQYQDVQMKAYQEIQKVFGVTDRDVDKTDFGELVYLDAVMKESLRLYPLISIIARTITSDVKLKNYTLEKGASVIISLYGHHRNQAWGADAEEFKPERWLSPETLPKNPNFWCPFGLGKRYCVGKSYAAMTMKTSLIHVLRNFKITSDTSKLKIKMDIVTKPASGQYVILEPRNP